MPNQVRIISKRNSAKWDDLVRDLLDAAGFEREHTYFGCINQERADSVRRCIRTAAKRRGVGSKVFWNPCPEAGRCSSGGPDCQFHVFATFFDLEVARNYKTQQAAKPRK